MDILNILQKEFNIKLENLKNVVKLIDEGNTIPFIARYRKELTGSLDDQVLREIFDRLNYLRNLEEKKEQTKKLIAELELLTDDIEKAIDNANTLTEVDDIYRPFRPKRRTRATIAKENGLTPLADIILLQNPKNNIEEMAETFLNENIKTKEDAISGALDIIAEIISDEPKYRAIIRDIFFKKALIVTKATTEESTIFDMYYDFKEPISKIAPHRILAINRGEKENILNVKIEIEDSEILNILNRKIVKKDCKYMKDAIEDAYKRLIYPSIEREIRATLTENAGENAIKIFGENLKQLLMQPPIKDKTVLAIDPAFRTGCKIAVLDGIGNVLKVDVIYPTSNVKEKIDSAKKTLSELLDKYHFEIIAIGNGTASRETELFVVDFIKKTKKDLHYIIVNEAGASVYSASKLGASEFPDYDVSLRSAVSIGRRLQDPLAELVKIEPKSIGVGQYQHDMNQKRLGEALGGVVENCVNTVGVDLNTASPSLLSYVSGISSTIAKNIIAYREENGKFKDRKELLKVSKLGAKTFLQCAGFLKISDGKEPLDNTCVHPESYDATKILLKSLNLDINNLDINLLKTIDIEKTASKLNIGTITLKDIINELEKPGRDPREDMPKPILRTDVLSMEDLKEGMLLKGTIRNVIDFGAFVDIGVHQDGLVHISEMSNKFIKHPLEAVSVSDIVDVKVLSVDMKKKRIALSMKI